MDNNLYIGFNLSVKRKPLTVNIIPGSALKKYKLSDTAKYFIDDLFNLTLLNISAFPATPTSNFRIMHRTVDCRSYSLDSTSYQFFSHSDEILSFENLFRNNTYIITDSDCWFKGARKKMEQLQESLTKDD